MDVHVVFLDVVVAVAVVYVVFVVADVVSVSGVFDVSVLSSPVHAEV